MKKVTTLVKPIEGLILVSFPQKVDPATAQIIKEKLVNEYGSDVVVKFVNPKNIRGAFTIKTYTLEG